MSVREMVGEIQRELLAGDVEPARGRELLVRLTALLANVNSEIREAEAAYSMVLLAHLNGSEAANRARIQAQITPEYARTRTAKDTKEVVVEMARSLKYLLRSTEEEMRLAR